MKKRAQKPQVRKVRVMGPFRLEFRESDEPACPGWHVYLDDDLHDELLVPDEAGCKLVEKLVAEHGGSWAIHAPPAWLG